MENKTDNAPLNVFLNSIENTDKEKLPITLLRLAEVGKGVILVDESPAHTTSFLPCYWFYKPISRTYKTFKDE